MEIYERIDELARVVEAARAMPLSTSCVVPRNDVLDLIDDIREALPASIKEADDVLAEREDLIEEATKQAQDALATAQTEASAVIAQAHQDSDQIIDNARAEADGVLDRARAESARLVDEQEVLLIAQEEAAAVVEEAQQRARIIVTEAQDRADHLIAEAEEQTIRERRQTDEFVDSKLADLEESLATSLTAVRRGRERVHGRRYESAAVDVRELSAPLGAGVSSGVGSGADVFDFDQS